MDKELYDELQKIFSKISNVDKTLSSHIAQAIEVDKRWQDGIFEVKEDHKILENKLDEFVTKGTFWKVVGILVMLYGMSVGVGGYIFNLIPK